MQKFIDTITAMANGALVPLSNAVDTAFCPATPSVILSVTQVNQ